MAVSPIVRVPRTGITVEKGLSKAEKILTVDVIGREEHLQLCHMLSRMAFEVRPYCAVSDVLTFCVLMDREVNAGPWVQMERRDKRCAEGRRVVVMTGICGGQFRKSPSVWHATVICLENSPPAGKQFPDDYLLSMEYLWTQARDTVGVEFFTEMTSVNEKDFNPVAFIAGLNLCDQLQHPQLPTWREQHELWIKKLRRQLRKQKKWPQKSKHAFEETERLPDRWNNIDIEKIDSLRGDCTNYPFS